MKMCWLNKEKHLVLHRLFTSQCGRNKQDYFAGGINSKCVHNYALAIWSFKNTREEGAKQRCSGLLQQLMILLYVVCCTSMLCEQAVQPSLCIMSGWAWCWMLRLYVHSICVSCWLLAPCIFNAVLSFYLKPNHFEWSTMYTSAVTASVILIHFPDKKRLISPSKQLV